VTTEPNAFVAKIHDRMPVILAPKDHDTWLTPDAPADRLKALLRPYPAKEMAAHKVIRVSPRPRCAQNRSGSGVQDDVSPDQEPPEGFPPLPQPKHEIPF